MAGYLVIFLLVVTLFTGLGVTIGVFVSKEIFYQKGIDDEASRWKNREDIHLQEGCRVEG